MLFCQRFDIALEKHNIKPAILSSIYRNSPEFTEHLFSLFLTISLWFPGGRCISYSTYPHYR